jgi:hypothetical protein
MITCISPFLFYFFLTLLRLCASYLFSPGAIVKPFKSYKVAFIEENRGGGLLVCLPLSSLIHIFIYEKSRMY